jgi:tetratricopeptide (TPR) repeat protein
MRSLPAWGCLVLVLCLCASFCLTRLAETDLHWHLLAGARILDEGRVPRVDTFSYTSSGNRWVDLQWLFEALVAAAHRRAGWAALDLLKILLVVSAFALAALAGLRRQVPPDLVAALALPAVLASQERFTLRPEAASFCLLGALLLCLGQRRDRPRLLFAVPPLLALWANLHALFAVGLAAVFLVALGDSLEALVMRRRAAGRPAPRPAPVLLAAGAAALATLLNPYGLEAWSLARRLLVERIATGNLYGRSIAEFQAPFGGYGPTAAIGAFAFLAALVLASSVPGRRRAGPADLLLLAAFLCLALFARRNVPLFALVAIPCGGPLAHEALLKVRERLGRRAGARETVRWGAPLLASAVAAGTLWLLADVWSNRFFERDGTQRYFGRGLSPGSYPERAADFVLEKRLAGEAIHDLAVGGFLAWRWVPERRVFIDGRLEVHDEALFATYLKIQSDPGFFEETARRYGARVFVAPYRLEYAPLLRHLSGGNGWRPVFVDLAAAVYVRDQGPAEGREALPGVDTGDPLLGSAILEQARAEYARAARLDPAPAFLRRLLPRREAPVAEVNAAIFFGMIGEHANAEILFREALAQAPRNAILHYDLGLVLEAAGKPRAARGEHEAALSLDQSFAPARAAYALRLLADGDQDGALAQWDIAEGEGPLGPVSLQARGALLASRGRLDEAIEDYRRAVRADPRRARLRADLALLYHRRGLRERALEEISRAAAADPRACPPQVALARITAADGRAGEAERIYREAISQDATCAEAHLGLAALLASGGRREEALQAASAAIGAGLEPAALLSEPALRGLSGTPAFRNLVEGGRKVAPRE